MIDPRISSFLGGGVCGFIFAAVIWDFLRRRHAMREYRREVRGLVRDIEDLRESKVVPCATGNVVGNALRGYRLYREAVSRPSDRGDKANE